MSLLYSALYAYRCRPYESVNRAMPGSYYSDVERTVYLTFVVLMEDIAKYDELFQQERKCVHAYTSTLRMQLQIPWFSLFLAQYSRSW